MSFQFKPITLDDKKQIETYTKPWAAECSDLSFTNLFIWGADKKMQFAEENNMLFIKLSFPGVPEFFWAPVPKKGTTFDYRAGVLKSLSYLEEKDIIPTIRSASDPFLALARQALPELIVTETPIASDYIYLSENMIHLKGKKLHSKRNHINKFILTNPDFKYLPLESSMYADCMRIYSEWSENKDEDDGALNDEQRSVKLALKNLTALDLVGGCIALDGKIEAFTVGERLTPDMQLIHIEKANPEINGLYPIVNQQYASKNCQDITFINREEDMGIDGMRQAKRSYQPVRMIDKFMITKKPPEELPQLWGEKE